MGIFGRMKTLIKANVNDLASKAENPERILNQLILEMKEQLGEAKIQVRDTITDQKVIKKKLDTALAESQKWEQKAMTAVRAGEDELAQEALNRKHVQDDLAAELHASHEAQTQNVADLKSALQKLGAKIEEAERKKASLVARAERVKAQEQIATSSVNKTTAFDEFERNAAKIEDFETEVAASAELNDTFKEEELEDKFSRLEADPRANDALAALKAKMGMDDD